MKFTLWKKKWIGKLETSFNIWQNNHRKNVTKPVILVSTNWKRNILGSNAATFQPQGLNQEFHP